MKVTTKLAKNDARLYYVDSKRVSRDKALESAAQNRVGNPFVVECDKEQNHYLIQGGIEKHIYTDRRTFDKLNIRIDNYHGFTVYCGTCQLRTFACNFGAKNFATQIEDAFINGEHGIKITVDGKIGILPAENVGNLTDSALAASNSRLAAFRMNDTEIDVSEYAISEDAFNFAVEQEIEDAEQAAFEARVTARTLADDNIAALYEKAKSQVKCELSNYGWRSWYFKGKNRTEWELDETKAAACLTRYGLSRWKFAIFHDAEVAVIESAGIDETAFDLLPNFEDDELRDYLYDFDERQQLLEDKYEPKTTADTVTEEDKTYTLTIYATEDFKGLYGSDTLVKNFDTCQRLYNSGKDIIFTNSWKLERGGKTIATGDGVKDFCRFITCEFDVSERLAEIVDAKSVDMEICGEHVYFRKGKFMSVMSPKYHALFHAEAGFDGTDHYDIFTADKNGKFTRGNFVTEEEFFNVMVERGGCTIEVDDYAVSPDAQDSEPVAEIQNAKFAQYLRDEAQREHEFELLAAFGKQAPEFKRFGSFKPKAAHIDATLQAKTFKPALCKEMFAQGRGKFVGKIEVGSYAEAMALIENVANDRFELDSEHQRNYFDEDGKFVEYCSREFINVDNQNEIFIFSEHFKNGKLTRVDFQKGFSFSYKCKCVEILIKPAPDTPVDAAIETLDDDMKDEVRAELEPFKAEYNAAITGIYLDDLSGGDSESGEIIPAAELLKNVIPLALTDFSSTAYRKNPDGNFSRDKAAFKRLEQLERKIFAANGHKIGVDNSGNTQPDDFAEKMAELTADLKEANDACIEACNFREMKRKEFDNACEAAEDAEILVRRKREAIAKFGRTCAKDLSDKLIDNTLILSPTMKVTNQAGGICKTDFEQIQIFFRDANLTFYVSTDWIFLGEYDTPAQVEAVILELKAAIKRGDEEFTFPTVEDFNGLVHISEGLAELPVIQKVLAQRSLTA